VSNDREFIVNSRLNLQHKTFHITRAGKLLDYTNDKDEDKERTKLMKFVGKIISHYNYLLSQ
jgi:hypothetical protein